MATSTRQGDFAKLSNVDSIKSVILSTLTAHLANPSRDIRIIRRNKNLKSGEFQIIWPSKVEKSAKPANSVHTDSSASPISTEKKLSPSLPAGTPSQSSPVMYNELPNGTIMVNVYRPEIFMDVLNLVGTEQQAYGKTSKNKKAFVNRVPSVSKNFDDEFTIYQLRGYIIEEHVKQLLSYNGYDVSLVGPRSDSDEHQYLQTIFSSVSPVTPVVSEADRNQCECELRSSKYHSKEEDKSRDSVLFLDLQKYLLDCGAAGYDRNIKLFNVEKNEQKFDQICMLWKLMHTKMDVLAHIVPYEQSFVQQQVDLCLKVAQESQTHQVHNVFGSVQSRGEVLHLPSAHDYFELRKSQMKEAFTMKYGKVVEGPDWNDTVYQLTVAVIKFELLSTACRQTLKIDVSEAAHQNNSIDGKGGVFALYNCARLANLFHKFDRAVDEGTYPPIPDINTLDYSLLREEEEWGLLWNYVIQYPDVLRDTVVEVSLRQTKSAVQTHKVCQFLLDMSRDLSSYYSRVHILVEPQQHLFPMMHARLTLLRAVEQVFHNALNLLGISPLSQL